MALKFLYTGFKGRQMRYIFLYTLKHSDHDNNERGYCCRSVIVAHIYTFCLLSKLLQRLTVGISLTPPGSHHEANGRQDPTRQDCVC